MNDRQCLFTGIGKEVRAPVEEKQGKTWIKKRADFI